MAITLLSPSSLFVQQASTAAMTQANQMPNIILELLKD